MTSSRLTTEGESAQDRDRIRPEELIRHLRTFAQRCIQRRRVFALSWIVFVSIAVVYILGKTPMYSASTRILPYKPANGGLPGMSGLASIAGVNLPFGTGTQV